MSKQDDWQVSIPENSPRFREWERRREETESWDGLGLCGVLVFLGFALMLIAMAAVFMAAAGGV